MPEMDGYDISTQLILLTSLSTVSLECLKLWWKESQNPAYNTFLERTEILLVCMKVREKGIFPILGLFLVIQEFWLFIR
jgi:hypothetical protein